MPRIERVPHRVVLDRVAEGDAPAPPGVAYRTTPARMNDGTRHAVLFRVPARDIVPQQGPTRQESPLVATFRLGIPKAVRCRTAVLGYKADREPGFDPQRSRRLRLGAGSGERSYQIGVNALGVEGSGTFLLVLDCAGEGPVTLRRFQLAESLAGPAYRERYLAHAGR